MGRAARTKTSKAAVKHTLKHARSPEGLVVGIEALGLHEAASDDEDLEAVAASLSSSVDAVAASLATSGLGSGLGSGMDTTHHGRERRGAPLPKILRRSRTSSSSTASASSRATGPRRGARAPAPWASRASRRRGWP